ncbi:MAG: BrnA antitoxin family protein [Rhodospirillaceae bacterium]|nr:BrnA antitoxin family protein [Rhodospirillaceae bacterium]
MKKETIIKRSATSRHKGKTDWKRVRALTDSEIKAAVRSDPDAELLTKDFWKNAKVVTPEPKVAISLRIDRDVLEHFKSEGGKYQTRMNAILRSYVDHKKRA